jgi:hypothetical protein
VDSTTEDLLEKNILPIPPNKEPSTESTFDAEKPPIAPISSNLGIKIPENAPYIVTRDGISIYSRDLYKTYIFQKIYKAYPNI